MIATAELASGSTTPGIETGTKPWFGGHKVVPCAPAHSGGSLVSRTWTVARSGAHGALASSTTSSKTSDLLRD